MRCKKAHFCGFLRAREGEMKTYEQTNLRRELGERLLPLRLALLLSRPAGERKGKRQSGWLGEMRQAIGMPVDDLARRMGVRRREVHRMERAEQNERIMLATLRRAAEGLGCELVYGLVPKEGTLEELAAAQTVERKIAAEERRRKREAGMKPVLEGIGWRETWMKALRAMLRKEGYRVRPTKTDRNIANEIDDFEFKVELLKAAELVGPFGAFEEEEEGVVGAGGEESQE